MGRFDDTLTDALEGRYVYAATSDGREYEGWVETLHPKYQHLLLRDATNQETGRDVGRVFIRQAAIVEKLDNPSRIERVPLDEIEPAPYSVRDLSAAENRGYIAKIRDRGFTGSFPVVRPHPTSDGYQIVEGHKRLWAAGKAGLDSHPVEITDVDDWELTLRFIADHLPDEAQVKGDGSTYDNCYGNDETEAAIERLRDEWGDRVLDVDEVAYNIERLGLETDEGGEDDEEADEEDDVDEPEPEPETGVAPEPAESMEEVVTSCDGVGPVTADTLARYGYDTLASIADADREDLTDIDGVGQAIAYRIIEAAEAAVNGDEDTSAGKSSSVNDTLSEGIDEELGLTDAEGEEGNESNSGVATDGSGAESPQAPAPHDPFDAVDVTTPGAASDRSDDAADVIEKYLPAGVTRDEVRELAIEHDHLESVADELGIGAEEARVLLVRLNAYSKVSEASRYRGGAD